MKCGLDICCFSIWGSHKILDIKDQSKYYPVHLKLNQIITQEDYKDKKTEEVSVLAHDYIQNGIDEIKIKNIEKFNLLNKKKKKN